MWCNVYGFFMFHEVLLSQSLWPLVDYKKQVALPWHWILPPLLQNEGTRPNSIPNQTNMSKNLHLLKKKTVALRFFSFLGKTKIHLPSALFIAPSLWLVFFTFGLRAVLKSNCSGIRQQCVQTPHFHYDWVTKNNCWESSSWAFFFVGKSSQVDPTPLTFCCCFLPLLFHRLQSVTLPSRCCNANWFWGAHMAQVRILNR